MRSFLMFVSLLLLIFTATAAWADDSSGARRVDRPVMIGDRQDCLFGSYYQDGDPYDVFGPLFGGQSFKYLISSPEQCSCSLGFEVFTIYYYVYFPETLTYPFTWEWSVDLEEAANHPGAPCVNQPGNLICQSEAFSTEVDGPGYWYFWKSIDCPCVVVYWPYYLTVNHLTPMPEPYYFLHDTYGAVPCRSWHWDGIDWVDMASAYGLPGSIWIWGYSDCCDLPVGDEDSTWGRVKELFE